eukprot:COSAG05_NODE_2021_length_3681_cov_40.184813_1_plen_60_part_10
MSVDHRRGGLGWLLAGRPSGSEFWLGGPVLCIVPSESQIMLEGFQEDEALHCTVEKERKE